MNVRKALLLVAAAASLCASCAKPNPHLNYATVSFSPENYMDGSRHDLLRDLSATMVMTEVDGSESRFHWDTNNCDSLFVHRLLRPEDGIMVQLILKKNAECRRDSNCFCLQLAFSLHDDQGMVKDIVSQPFLLTLDMRTMEDSVVNTHTFRILSNSLVSEYIF